MNFSAIWFKIQIFIQENTFENVVCKITAISLNLQLYDISGFVVVT